MKQYQMPHMILIDAVNEDILTASFEFVDGAGEGDVIPWN